MLIKRLLCLLFLFSAIAQAQNGSISGFVRIDGTIVPSIKVELRNTPFQILTDSLGNYRFPELPFGEYTIRATYTGYTTKSIDITISSVKSDLEINFDLKESLLFDEVVVTGTKTDKTRTNSAVIVNVISSQTLDNVQACNLAEGLKFQSGLRVETDCQTCNYTQLRMNGLAGGYSQILINGRPIFSPLTGLYGMEQLPINMIEKIEIVRGGGSSLYGSSAIGGTVNVITKIPIKNNYELNYSYQNINGRSNDQQILGNGTLVSKNKKSGISVFINHRNRDYYDHNRDNFSELPLLQNTSFGINTFLLPKENQKLEVSISNLNEYRLGGEMTDKPAHLAEQSEERTHHVWMLSTDYQINFKNKKTSFISYFAFQNTTRKHYTGILPEEDSELQSHIVNPPYGASTVNTFNGGIQLNQKIPRFLKGTNIITLGAEYVLDDVFDEINAYEYLIDQTTEDIGAFVQSDWEILRQLTLLSGVRMDVHNLIDKPLFNPRISLLYKLKSNAQFRFSYGTGFRAPQSFDTDLHIAFAGGGVSRITLSPDLTPEQSQSLSGSINYDKPLHHFIAGFTLEGFYTQLKDAFILQPVGEDDFGMLFEKQNGQGATVQGITLEIRANYDRKLQLETGLTLQTSRYDQAVNYIESVEGTRTFIRTPNEYGYATLNFTPNKKLNATMNWVYTGRMQVPHFAGADNQAVDEIISTNFFHELGVKIGYTIPIDKLKCKIEIYGGIKNILDAYQSEFDVGKYRDSNFIYGPAQPRTFYVGIKLKSI